MNSRPATPSRRALLVSAGIAVAAVTAVVATHIDRAEPVPSLTQGRPTGPPPTPKPTGGVLPPDGSTLMRGGEGEEMGVSVQRIADAAAVFDPAFANGPPISPRPGYRAISVLVRFTNTDRLPFPDDIEKHAWLVGKDGNTYPYDPEMTDARRLTPAAPLAPREVSVRDIVFEVRDNVELTHFRVSGYPGRSRQTRDWRLA